MIDVKPAAQRDLLHRVGSVGDGPATPYDLKQLAQVSTAKFWSVPHTQLYTECARLAREGLLSEQREQTGRRRRIYRLTDAGSQALEQWRSEPPRNL